MAFPFTRHRIWQLVVDGALVAAAWWLAFQLRFDSGVPPYYDTLFSRTILIVVAIKLAVFVAFGFYNRWWRYVSTRDMWATSGIGKASARLFAEEGADLVITGRRLELGRGVEKEIRDLGARCLFVEA